MFQIDKRVLYVVMAVLVLISLSSYLIAPDKSDKLVELLLTIPAVLIAITFHEFAHAFAADKLGDDTPRRQGRLSLNPFAHLDPIGSIMLVFAGFGWGKPVEINPRNFNRDRSMTASEAIVAAAGPLMNFILAIIFTLITGITLMITNSYIQIATDEMRIITTNQMSFVIIQMLMACVSVNLGLGIFNLIPLPPLDGSKVLKNFLPYNAKQWMDRNNQILYIIFIVIWITPIASMIITPILSGAYKTVLCGILKLFGRII